MGAASRRKGAHGERELFALLSAELGVMVRRRLGAARDGGADSLDVTGWCVEVKRTERWESQYWQQTLRQAQSCGWRPVLFHRRSREAWRAYVDPHDIDPDIWPRRGGDPVVMTVETWCQLARERVRAQYPGRPG